MYINVICRAIYNSKIADAACGIVKIFTLWRHQKPIYTSSLHGALRAAERFSVVSLQSTPDISSVPLNAETTGLFLSGKFGVHLAWQDQGRSRGLHQEWEFPFAIFPSPAGMGMDTV